MLPLLPALIGVLPTLVGLAERVITKPAPGVPGRGPEKKDLVLHLLGEAFDTLAERGRIPSWAVEERETILLIASRLIDRIVAAMKSEGKL